MFDPFTTPEKRNSNEFLSPYSVSSIPSPSPRHEPMPDDVDVTALGDSLFKEHLHRHEHKEILDAYNQLLQKENRLTMNSRTKLRKILCLSSQFQKGIRNNRSYLELLIEKRLSDEKELENLRLRVQALENVQRTQENHDSHKGEDIKNLNQTQDQKQNQINVVRETQITTVSVDAFQDQLQGTRLQNLSQELSLLNEKLNACNDTIQTLKETIHLQKKELEVKNETIDEQKHQLELLANMNSDLNKQNLTLDASLKELQTKLHDVTSKLDESRVGSEKNSDTSDDCKNNFSDEQMHSFGLDENSKNQEVLRDILSQKESEISEYTQKLHESEDTIHKLEQQVQDYLVTISNLNQQLEAAKNEFEKQSVEISLQAIHLQHLQDEMKRQQIEIDKTFNNEIKPQIVEVQLGNKSSKVSSTQSEKTNDVVDNEIIDKTEQVVGDLNSDSKNEDTSDESIKSISNDSIKSVEVEVVDIVDIVEVVSIDENVDHSNVKKVQNYSEVENTLKRPSTSKHLKTSDARPLSEAYDSLRDRYSDLESQFEELEDENYELRDLIDKLKSERRQLEEKLANLEEKLNTTTKNENSPSNDKENESKVENTAPPPDSILPHEAYKNVKEVDILLSENMELLANNDKHLQTIESLKAELYHLKHIESISNTTDTTTNIDRGAIESQTNEIQEENLNLRNQLEEHKEKYEILKQKSSEEIAYLRESLNIWKNKYEALNTSSLQAMEIYENRIGSLETKLRDLIPTD